MAYCSAFFSDVVCCGFSSFFCFGLFSSSLDDEEDELSLLLLLLDSSSSSSSSSDDDDDDDDDDHRKTLLSWVFLRVPFAWKQETSLFFWPMPFIGSSDSDSDDDESSSPDSDSVGSFYLFPLF